jgi:hypothetical protein
LLKLGSLKKYFIRKSFRKLLLEKELIRVVSQNEINTVGIIVAEDIFSLIDLQREVEKGLNLQNAKIYSFRTYSRKNAFSDKHFSEKYFGWNGQVTQPGFKVFIDIRRHVFYKFFYVIHGITLYLIIIQNSYF